MRFAATFDAGDIRKGAAEAVASLKNVSREAGKTASTLDATGGAFRKAAKESGYFYDRLGRLHAANGKYASSAQKAAIQTKAVGSSSEKAGKQMQGFGSGSDSASKSLAHASSVADALNQRFASLTQRVLSVYAAYKLLDGVVATTNIGIQANKNWESQKLAIASIVSSTNQLSDAQGRVLEGAEKFTASQQVAEELMKRIQQLGLETTATTQELVTGFQAIIAPALKAGYALEEIPELATRAAQAMGAFQIPIQQMRTEIESLLSGNINRAQDLLAGYLNVTGKMIKDWKAQGILVEEINKRLESFRYSSDAIANTWAGLTSNIQEYFEFISRGSTSGLFDSMKSSVRELQSLMISMNKDTGLAEVSSKVNNIAEAWRRMNDFIGNKILVSTGRFTDWIEELNNPENLAVFETTLSNIWTGIENGASLIGKVGSAFGELSSKAISGWNSMPEIIRDVGIVGAMLYGKRGLLIFGTAMAAFDRLNNIAKGTRYFVQSGEMSFSELFSMPWDELGKKVGQVDKNISGFRGTYNATVQDVKSGNTSIKTSSLLDAGAGDKSKSELNKISNALKSVDTDLARVQMTDAGFRQFQIDQKVADLEKNLGATNPRVQELRAELEKKLQNDFLEEVIGYADPAEKQMIDLQKAYQKFNDTLKASTKLNAEEKFDLQAKAAKRYVHAIDEVNTEQKQLLEFQKETSRIEAENSNDQATLWQMKVDRYEKELWYVEDIAERRSLIEGRINAELAAENKRYTADFGKMWEETYNRIDQAGADMLENFLNGTKNTFDSLKKMFIRTLAEMANAAWLRPITVQIMGTLGGVFGVGGTALAYDSATGKMVNASGSGLLGNLPFSSLLPDSWTSGVSSFLSYELPGTAPGISGLYGPTMGGGNLASGLSLGSALMYGGLGSLGYSLLGGALGLPQNKYSGITSGLGAGLGAWGASAALSGTALGATLGSAVPVVGTVIGAALGGLASSLFGGGKKTHPSVYTNVVDASLFGSDWEALMTQGAWTDRASVSDAAGIFKGLGEVANTTASSIMGFAQALPEEYQAQVLARLNAETVSFGRGSTAGRKGVTDYGPSTWNFQFHDEEQLQEVINTAGEDIQRVMLNALQRAMAGTDLSSMLAVDLSSTEGLDKAIQAINAINTVTEATANIKEPLSEMEQQTKAARAQLDEWTESMRSLGVNADYAGKLMEDYRHAYIDNVIESLDESLHPLSAYEQAVKTANEAVDQRKKALEIIGATEGQLAQVEAMRAEVVKQATEEMLRSFDQSVAQRWAAVNGNSDEVGRAISQANELRETIQQFGEGSAQVAELLKLHAAETAKAAQDAAKSEYDSLKAQMDALEQQRVQLQQQAIQEQINAINEQLSAAKTLKNTWEGLDKSLGQSRYNLFAGSANLDAENRLGTVQAEFRRLSGLALGGDSDAAGQLAGVGNSLLDLVKQTTGTEEEYLDAFWAVNAQLKAAQEAAGAQVSAADKQLEALQGQLDVQNAALKQLQGQSATLEEIEKQIADLKPLLDAAGQKAGVKAFARGGLAMPGWSLVGEEGPELVNFSQPGRVYTAADTAALFRSVTPRAADTDSGSREEVKALRREVYQLRRDMLISMSEIARFSRRTSDMVEAWDAEGMPGVRA